MRVFMSFMAFGLLGLSVFVMAFAGWAAETLRTIREAQRIQSKKLDLVMTRYYKRRPNE